MHSDTHQSVNTRSSQLQRITSSFVQFVSLVDWWISTFLSWWRRMLAWLFSATRNHRSRRKTSMVSHSTIKNVRDSSTSMKQALKGPGLFPDVCVMHVCCGSQLLQLMNTFTHIWTLSTLWPPSLQQTCLIYRHLKYETSSKEFRGQSWHNSWMTTSKNVLMTQDDNSILTWLKIKVFKELFIYTENTFLINTIVLSGWQYF